MSVEQMAAVGQPPRRDPELAGECAVRIVNYNVFNNPDDANEQSLMTAVFQGIANQSVNGIAKPIDIITLHEVDTLGNTTDSRASSAGEPERQLSDRVYGLRGGRSERHRLQHEHRAPCRLGYDHARQPFGPPRHTSRRVQPNGYTSPDADFYVYAMHLKSDSSSSSNTELRGSVLPRRLRREGNVNAIYAGDFNIGSTSERPIRRFALRAMAQGFDPVLDPQLPHARHKRHHVP